RSRLELVPTWPGRTTRSLLPALLFWIQRGQTAGCHACSFGQACDRRTSLAERSVQRSPDQSCLSLIWRIDEPSAPARAGTPPRFSLQSNWSDYLIRGLHACPKLQAWHPASGRRRKDSSAGRAPRSSDFLLGETRRLRDGSLLAPC